jgi:hypothetical protein
VKPKLSVRAFTQLKYGSPLMVRFQSDLFSRRRLPLKRLEACIAVSMMSAELQSCS